MKIGIVDYGMGNLLSIKSILDYCFGNPYLCKNSDDILEADGLVLPGVGAFGDCMANINGLSYLNTLHHYALTQKRPVLGICLGMQVMASTGNEHGVPTEGLGWFSADVTGLEVEKYKLKKPHIGYNGVRPTREHDIFSGLSDNAEFYFVHSYHFKNVVQDDVLATTDYGEDIVSAVVKDNLIGVQFHPEKSHENGIQFMENFVDFVSARK